MAKTCSVVTNKSHEYITRRLIDPKGEFTIWGKTILQAYSRIAKLAFVPMLGLSRRCEILVLGARIFNQLSEATRKQTHLVMTARDILRCKSIPRSLTYDLKTYSELYSLIENHNLNAYASCRRRVELILSKTQAKIVIANSTIDPINRLWIQVANDMGLRTVCVQHGVYSESIPKHVLEEDIIDHYVALDEGQKLILQKNIAAEKIIPLGMRDTFDWKPPSGQFKICFIGEDWERYGFHKLKHLIIGRYIEIAKYLKPLGYKDFFYKPHPSEEMFLNIFDYAKLLGVESIDVPDVYVGFASTLLKDVSSRRKLAIQIWDKETGADNFEALGYCLSITNSDDLLEGILNMVRVQRVVPFIINTKLDEVLM
jgi:hypothetical protein